MPVPRATQRKKRWTIIKKKRPFKRRRYKKKNGRLSRTSNDSLDTLSTITPSIDSELPLSIVKCNEGSNEGQYPTQISESTEESDQNEDFLSTCSWLEKEEECPQETLIELVKTSTNEPNCLPNNIKDSSWNNESDSQSYEVDSEDISTNSANNLDLSSGTIIMNLKGNRENLQKQLQKKTRLINMLLASRKEFICREKMWKKESLLQKNEIETLQRRLYQSHEKEVQSIEAQQQLRFLQKEVEKWQRCYSCSLYNASVLKEELPKLSHLHQKCLHTLTAFRKINEEERSITRKREDDTRNEIDDFKKGLVHLQNHLILQCKEQQSTIDNMEKNIQKKDREWGKERKRYQDALENKEHKLDTLIEDFLKLKENMKTQQEKYQSDRLEWETKKNQMEKERQQWQSQHDILVQRFTQAKESFSQKWTEAQERLQQSESRQKELMHQKSEATEMAKKLLSRSHEMEMLLSKSASPLLKLCFYNLMAGEKPKSMMLSEMLQSIDYFQKSFINLKKELSHLQEIELVKNKKLIDSESEVNKMKKEISNFQTLLQQSLYPEPSLPMPESPYSLKIIESSHQSLNRNHNNIMKMNVSFTQLNQENIGLKPPKHSNSVAGTESSGEPISSMLESVLQKLAHETYLVHHYKSKWLEASAECKKVSSLSHNPKWTIHEERSDGKNKTSVPEEKEHWQLNLAKLAKALCREKCEIEERLQEVLHFGHPPQQ